MGITAAMPAGWMRGSIGFAAAKGEGRKEGSGRGRGRGRGVSYPSPLKIPQFSLFSACVYRLLGPASHFDCTPHVNKPQRHTEATSPVKLRVFYKPYGRNVYAQRDVLASGIGFCLHMNISGFAGKIFNVLSFLLLSKYFRLA